MIKKISARRNFQWSFVESSKMCIFSAPFNLKNVSKRAFDNLKNVKRCYLNVRFITYYLNGNKEAKEQVLY